MLGIACDFLQLDKKNSFGCEAVIGNWDLLAL
jgi:hypothetical protein